MPQYEFICRKCNSEFIVECIMSEISDLKPCCKLCNSKKTARKFSAPIINIPKTLGSLADKNTDTFSDDYKNHLNKKHNKYRFKEEFQGKLPEGAKTFERDSDGKRKSNSSIKPKRNKKRK